ncbi:hypothetical protein [Hamadaea tsunoensis]|uniref:hypothetical protein n=1 Tax=Hamadaea tsunoensis TaxID=53368 RepID=UPI000428BED5|nr:hypothetical protein [Hamadaea tsunoensis]
MDNLIAILSATVSVIGAVIAGVMTTWSNKKTRAMEARLERERHEQTKAEQAAELISRYREPLLLAANSLQSRLFNAVRDEYLPVYLRDGSDDEQSEYARNFTVYTLAEYLCWVEIIRRELRFLDLGGEQENRRFNDRMQAVSTALATQEIPQEHFRLFRGQQRALGELLMVPLGATGHHESMTYPEFVRRIGDDLGFRRWFERLLTDVSLIRDETLADNVRIVRTQHALIDLIDFLDPGKTRLGAAFREKYEWPAPSPASTTS